MRARNLLNVFFAVAALAALTGPAAAQSAPDAAALSWNHKPFADSTDDFHFAILSDNTGGAREGVFADAVAKTNLIGPSFVMCIGDLVEGYADDPAELDKEWSGLTSTIASLNAPFFGTVGNHDISNDVMIADTAKRFGPLYYSFVYRNVLFLVLNSQDDPAREDAYRSGIGQAQVDFALDALADNASVRWTFVFMHQPLFDRTGEYAAAPGWTAIENALASRPHTVFAGHWHEYAKYEVNGHDYYRLATTGGVSELGGAEKGQFDQIVWVTMTSDGPVIANLALGGIYADDVSTQSTTAAYGSVTDGSVIKVASIITTGQPSASLASTATINNPTDFTLAVTASFGAAPGLRINPPSIEAAVAPHSTSTVDVSITAAESLDFDIIEPIKIEWSARYDVPGKSPIEGSGATFLAIESVHACPRAAAPITVDGDLSDWPSLPLRLAAPLEFARNAALWEGPADSSVDFGVEYDDQYLYLGFKVTDDRVVVDSEHNARQEDALTVVIDARPKAARSAAPAGSEGRLFLVASPAAVAGQEELGEPLPEGAKLASVITPTGYNTEIAIPVALLDKAAGSQWGDFRLNFRLHDLDSNEWNNTLMWWRPSWEGALDYPGSGTFRRE